MILRRKLGSQRVNYQHITLSVLYCTQLIASCNTSLQVQSFLVFHFIGVQYCYWYVIVNSL